MTADRRQAYLVSHTHWDREWYLTFSRFRVNLIETVDGVLKALQTDEHFKAFVLDGQCALLEDYLEAVPEQADALARLVAEGRLAVGPWYVLPDEFLVSGEATVRNLIVGGRVADGLARDTNGDGHSSTTAESAGAQKVGYMPDSFGHLAQIPQILRLADIDSFVFTRGLGDEAAELGWLFRWGAPDGSEVLAVNQCDGYCNAGGLGFAEIWHAHTRRLVDGELAVTKIRDLIAKMDRRPGADVLLMNNGCDHFPVQQDFAGILTALREALPDVDFHHGRFEDFLAAARRSRPDDQRPQWQGEMLGGRDHLILSGVWSSRMYLKQENEACQNLLCRYLEPLAAMARFRYGESWPDGLLAVAWRDLLRNHPHDSICGCSTDDVHHDMQTRFAAVRQTGEQYLSRLLDRLTPTFARREADDRLTVLNVTNPLPQRRDEVVERLVVMQPLDYDLESLRLIDEDGREVPCEILRTRFLERFWGVDYRAELFCEDQLDIQTTYLRRFGHRIVGTEYDRGTMDAFLHVRFLARDLPGLGHRQYYLVDGRDIRNALPFYAPDPGEPSVAFTPVQARLDDPGTARLSNEHLRVTLYGDGTCDVEDRATGHFYAGLNMLEDTEDAGDEYDYSPAPGGMTYFAAGTPGKVRLVRCTELAATASTTFSFDLPRSLESDRHSRQTRTTPCDVTVSVTLHSGQRRLDFVTEVNNRAFDHRLRAWFPSGLRTSTVVSDGQFLLNSRPLQRPTGKGWSQPAPPTWPQQDFSLLSDAQGGLAVFNRGLPEFETFPDSNGDAVLALTLLRCVDWLSRDDFPSRNQTNAGPTLYTPDAQCIGRHVFRYAVAPFSGDPVAADIKGQSERYRTPPLTHQGVADQLRPGGSAFLEKTAPEVAVTAVKLAEHDDRLVVRLCNLAAEPAVETLRCGLPVLAVEKAGLLEQPLPVERDPATLSTDGHGVEIPLAAHEIATVMIRLDHGPQDEETP